jgi:hypothetical protein
MPLTFQAQTDVRLFRAVIKRLIRPWALATGAAMLVIAGAAAVLGRYGFAAGYALIAVALALVLPAEIARLTVQRQSAKIGHVAAYRFGPDGIRILAGFQEQFLTWPEVTRVERWNDQIAVFLGRRRLVGIPTGGRTPDQIDELLEVLNSRGTLISTAP